MCVSGNFNRTSFINLQFLTSENTCDFVKAWIWQPMSCIKRSFWKVVIQRTFRGWWSRRLQVFQVEVAPETFLTLEIGRHLHDFGGRKRTGCKNGSWGVISENCGNFGLKVFEWKMCQRYVQKCAKRGEWTTTWPRCISLLLKLRGVYYLPLFLQVFGSWTSGWNLKSTFHTFDFCGDIIRILLYHLKHFGRMTGEIGRRQNGRRRANEAFLLKDCVEGGYCSYSAVEELIPTIQDGTNASFIEALKKYWRY